MADKRISQLSAVSNLLPNAELAISQSGVTYKTTALKVAQLFGTNTSNTVLVDGTTITGDGASVPLSALIPATNVVTDGTTIGGNGTTAYPLTFVGTANVISDDTLTGSGSASSPLAVANPLPLGGSDSQVLKKVSGVPAWADERYLDAVAWEPSVSRLTFYRTGGLGELPVVISVGSDGWGNQVVQTDTTLKGEGTGASALGINTVGAAAGEVLSFTGTGIAWITVTGSGESGDDWGSQVVQTDSTLTGEGTGGNTLKVANPLPAIGTEGYVLTVVSGVAAWAVNGSGLTEVATDSTLTGDGTGGDPLVVAHPLPAVGDNGQVLTVVSGVAAWATPATYLDAVTSNSTLTGDGTDGDPLAVAHPLPAVGSNNQVLTVVGGLATWAAAQNNYITSISVSGTVTKTITIQRQGLSNITTTFTDLTASSGGDNWGDQWVITDGTLSGKGITGDVLTVVNAVPDGINGQTLKWIGDEPTWIDVVSGGGLDEVATDSTLTGDGTSGDVLKVANPLPSGTSTQTLYHNGTAWAASSLIQNDNSTLGIGVSPLSSIKVNVQAGAGFLTTLAVTNTDSTQNSKAIEAYSAVNSGFVNVAGKFLASNSGAGTSYGVQIEDGTESIGKYLKCVTSDGHAQWATLPSGVSGVEYQTLRFNASDELEASSVLKNNGTSLAFGLATLGDTTSVGLYGESSGANTFSKVIEVAQASTLSGNKYAVHGRSTGANGTNYGGHFQGSSSTGSAYGIRVLSGGDSAGTNVGAYISADNVGAGNAYALRLEDGEESADKVLRCVDGDGNAQWSNIILLLKEASIPTYTPSGTTQTIDLANNLSHKLDLGSATGDVTLTLSNPRLGVSYIIEVTQDNTTPRDIVWPATVKWAGGSAPTVSTGALAIDTIVLWWNGSNYRGVYSQNFS